MIQMRIFRTKNEIFINPEHVQSMKLQQIENKYSVIYYTQSRKIEILFSNEEEAEKEINRFIKFIEDK